MLLSGDWLVPRLNGLPFFHKPPLLHWLQAAAMALLGPSAWAGRLVPALAAACDLRLSIPGTGAVESLNVAAATAVLLAAWARHR